MKLLANLTGTERRRMLEAGVLCALAVAGWAFFVRPREQALERKRSDVKLMRERVERARVDAQSMGLDHDSIRLAASMHQDLTEWIALGRTGANLYDDVTELARDNGLTLASVNPTPSRPITIRQTEDHAPARRATGGRRAAAAAKASGTQRSTSTDVRAELVGYRIAVSGSFESIMKYVQECEDLIPSTRVSGFSIKPGKYGDELDATIETTHLIYQLAQSGSGKPGKRGST